MNAAAKLGAYGLLLALLLGAGAAVGAAVGPIDTADDHDEDDPARPSEEETLPGGVLISQSGFTLETDDTEMVGAGGPFRFRITGPDGRVVLEFEPRHERELHLIVVGADLASFAHLHPTRDGDGTWTARLPMLAPGVYRAFADFAVRDGPELVLGVDLAVAGEYRPQALPERTATAVVDGYDVTLSGTPVAGSDSEVTLTVKRDGKGIEDLEPYLGAFGHLVAIRNGDLAYLHVHPLDEGGERGGPTVRFGIDVPSPGDYRLFFDFAHRGTVRTAAFTVSVQGGHLPASAPGEHRSGGHRRAVTEEGR